MLLAQDSAPGLALWSLGLSALWSAALSAQSGEDRFGDRRIVLAHAGSIIPCTGIAGITPVDGIIIKLMRNEARRVGPISPSSPNYYPERSTVNSDVRYLG
jgi:hypothetical protein